MLKRKTSPRSTSARHTSPVSTVRRRDGRRVFLIGFLVTAVLITVYGVSRQSAPLIIAGVVGFLLVCTVGGYTDNWTWTGMGPVTRHTRNHEEYQQGKTLWDILQLAVVPSVLTLGVVWFNGLQSAAQTHLAIDQTRENVLDSYFSQIADLMLKNHLGLQAGAPIRAIGRARTLTALSRLDARRQSTLVRFLSEANLVPVIDLSVVNLQGVSLQGFDLSCLRTLPGARFCADLRYAWLNHADLSYSRLAFADLSNAHLAYSDLTHADLVCAHPPLIHQTCSPAPTWLSYADLSYAILAGADLTHASLLGVRWNHTTCPDGTNSANNGTAPQSCQGHLKPRQRHHPHL